MRSLCSISHPPQKKQMLRRRRRLVFLSPETLRYSYDFIAKNHTPMASWHIAVERLVEVLRWSSRIVDTDAPLFLGGGPHLCSSRRVSIESVKAYPLRQVSDSGTDCP